MNQLHASGIFVRQAFAHLGYTCAVVKYTVAWSIGRAARFLMQALGIIR